MTLPAYPGRSTAASYDGPHVPAECPDGHRSYIPPVTFGGRRGYCTKCDKVVEWDYWREVPA